MERESDSENAAGPAADRRFLFICGCPRSGTTALVRLLNEHPAVALGAERYKNIAVGRRYAEFLPALFEPARFLDIKPEETNNPNLHLPGKFAGRHPIRVVGDKIPHLYRRFAHVHANFPKARIVAIFRDPADVALSWQRRADTPADPWPASHGAERALLEWKSALDRVSESLALRGQALTILSYESFFRVADAEALAINLKRLLAALGLRMHQDNLPRAAAAIFTPPRRGAARALPPALDATAAALRADASYQALLARAI